MTDAQIVNSDNLPSAFRVQKSSDEMAANVARSAGYEYVAHVLISFPMNPIKQ